MAQHAAYGAKRTYVYIRKILQSRQGRCVGGKVLLIAYTVDIPATGGATMRSNETIINESRLEA